MCWHLYICIDIRLIWAGESLYIYNSLQISFHGFQFVRQVRVPPCYCWSFVMNMIALITYVRKWKFIYSQAWKFLDQANCSIWFYFKLTESILKILFFLPKRKGCGERKGEKGIFKKRRISLIYCILSVNLK